MPRVLITSRQGDADTITRRLERDLTDAFGYDNVLTNHIRHQPGLDVRGELARRLTHSHALLVIIGRFWERDPQLNDPVDSIRLSIELGLQAHGLTVIPILVEGAVMPLPDALPTALRSFTTLTPLNLRENPDYAPDLDRLITTIRANAVEDRTYASTPARIETFSKPPADFSGMSPSGIERPAPARAASPATGSGVSGIVGKGVGGCFGFILSLFATALRQMVRSVVSFVMGIVIFVAIIAVLGFAGITLLGDNTDLMQAINQLLEQVNTIIQQIPQDMPQFPDGQ